MSASDKIKGAANEAIGSAKQGIGKIVGSDKLKVEGVAQEVLGKAQVAVGKAKETIKKGATAAADAINKKL